MQSNDGIGCLIGSLVVLGILLIVFMGAPRPKPPPPPPTPVVMTVVIIETSLQPFSVGNDWKTTVQTPSGERITLPGKLGKEGDTFQIALDPKYGVLSEDRSEK